MDETSSEIAGKGLTTTGHIDNGDLEPPKDTECLPVKKITLNEAEVEPTVSTNGIDTEEKNDFHLQNEKLSCNIGENVENLPEEEKKDEETNNGVGEEEKKEESQKEEDKPLISFDDTVDFEKPQQTSVSVPEKCTDNFISLLDQSLSVINTGNQNVSEEESKNKSDNVSEDVEMVNISDSNNLDSNLTGECEKDTLENEEKCDKLDEGQEEKKSEECKNLENLEEDKPMETELVSCDDLVESSHDGENRENPSLDKQPQVNLFEEMEVDELIVENDALEGNEKSDALAESEKLDTLAESEKSDTLAESEKLDKFAESEKSDTLAESEKSDGMTEDEKSDEKSDLKESELEDKSSGNINEEETITPDTNNQKESSSVDEEICIIPDDVSPRTNKDKEEGGKDKEEESGKANEGNGCDGDLLVTRRNEKRREYGVSKKVKTTGTETEESSKNSISSEVQVAEDVAVVEESESRVGGTGDLAKTCAHCKAIKVCKFQITESSQTHNLCSDQCYNAFKENSQPESESNDLQNTDPFARKCAECRREVIGDERCLSWETMDFCNEDCLLHYQNALGAYCANCKENVIPVSMGKYCVRFGYDVRQFCTSSCLEEYKKGLKFCSYCQKDISTGTGFLAPVGDQGQFKDFCEQSCMEKYERMGSNAPPPEVIEECAVCSNSKPVRVEVELDNKTQKLCSEPCFAAFKFVNNITDGQCNMCKKYFDRTKKQHHSIYYEDSPLLFCCKTCMNVYILANRKIVPCNRCKVKKYNFDMIKKVNSQGQVLMMCSLNCLTLYQKMIQKCECCSKTSQSQYHLTMSDGSVRNFCGYNCVITFQNQFQNQTISLLGEGLKSPVPIGGPKRVLPRRTQTETPCVPVISSVQSLASTNGQIAPTTPTRVALSASDVNLVPQVAQVTQVTQVSPITQTITLQSTPVQTAPTPQVYQQIITKPPQPKEVKNKAILCKPYTFTKGVSCRPHPCMKETQTDESLNRKCLIPIPVPIYVPAPMNMWASPFPVPVPFPLPVPVPIFIPTTRNSAKGIFKEIKKIQEKIPTDPFEAELLMMAEMVAGDKKQDPTDSESDEGNDADEGPDNTFSPENVDTSNTFGDDMLQMALKMASELEEPAVDMESVLTSNTITPTSQPQVDPNKALYAADPDDPDQVPVMMNRGRKRAIRGGRNSSGGNQSKRGRRTSGSVDVPMLPPPEPVAPPRIEVEKPDANMCLKYTFGVNAWRHWVMQKNAELEKAALTNRKIKLFKPELLQLTADELNFSLCLFVKEVRKPNGTEYAPDTIYYLCLGIQQYLFENGRIDNIFTDSYYEKFTDCLDEVAKKFAALYNDSQYIVTRVEEEHLWESKQLGAHSPHVLLSTLMFFNTKHFNLVTVEEHMQLSFSHIMKHWKRNPNAPGVAKVPGSRNVLLRFYPPQSALEANSRKKKVYEQQENEENPLRCPVKLYEFYLSKCPESVKTRNDVFYLLPERSCVPDSPVWYSTMALGKEPLMKMLHRVKMVKEINIALLTC